jgi:hypothetical protein
VHTSIFRLENVHVKPARDKKSLKKLLHTQVFEDHTPTTVDATNRVVSAYIFNEEQPKHITKEMYRRVPIQTLYLLIFVFILFCMTWIPTHSGNMFCANNKVFSWVMPTYLHRTDGIENC